METCIDLISLAHEYLAVAITEEPDEFAPEEERRAYAALFNMDSLIHAVRWLGEH